MMHKYFVCLALSLTFTCRLVGQVFPGEGRVVNYRIVGFTVPDEEIKSGYVLEIADGVYNDEAAFKKHIIKTERSARPAIVAEVPDFGRQYTWRVIGGKSAAKARLHHFATGMAPEVNPDSFRLRILSDNNIKESTYVFVDRVGALYDNAGKPVWYLPGNSGDGPTDLKMTPAGTITFLFGGKAYEVNYNGDTLWSMSSPDAANGGAGFHHDFTRMDNGHYMVLDHRNRYRKLPSMAGITAKDRGDSDRCYHKITYDVLREYDQAGSMVWEWHSSKYFLESDLAPIANTDVNAEDDILHLNSFYLDAKTGSIYLSSKNTSRIIKIRYPEGTVLAGYGKKYEGGFVPGPEGIATLAGDLYYGQHSCRLNDAGNLYLYNNNARLARQQLPEIIEMKEPATAGGTLKEVWRYQCTVDNATVKLMPGRGFAKGGNVESLGKGKYFVSMSAPYCKLFVVGHDKKEVWSALPEQWNTRENRWMPVPVYRASMIRQQTDLERMLFGGK